MRGPDDLIGIGHAFNQLPDAFAPQGGNAVADGVGDIQRLRAGLDHRFEYTAEKVHLGAHCVLGGEFDVVGVLQRQFDRLDRCFDNLVGLHAQLLFHVDRAGRDKGVDAPGSGRLDRLAGGAHIALVGARQRANSGILDDAGNASDRFGIARAGSSKTGFNDIDAESLQLPCDAHFLVLGHRGTRALLAIAQGGVENNQLVMHGVLHMHRGPGIEPEYFSDRRLQTAQVGAGENSQSWLGGVAACLRTKRRFNQSAYPERP